MALYVDIEKRLGNFHLKAQFQAGDETLALLGASGCGKSMTLKCIAGIEKPDRGRIVLDGVPLFDSEKRINLPPQKRHTGLLFQNYALFPHMTVEQNLLAGAAREKDGTHRKEAVNAMLHRFGLWELRNHYPHQLSGGQQQRTALARLLVSQPKILLLDEPFSALDSHLRFQMQEELRRVMEEFGKTVLFVSHDRDEVFRMCQSIALMGKGTIDTIGTKKAVFADPKTTSGAALTGCKNISRVIPEGETCVFATDWGITLTLPQPLDNIDAIGVRMHDIKPGQGENTFPCQVVEEIENPFSYTLMVRPLDAPHAKPIGVEIQKENWQKQRGSLLDISISAASILPLRDDTREDDTK